MQALHYLDAGRPELIDVPSPEPGPGEILVKVEAVTTCPHWDLHLMAGEPMFPGHQLKFPYSVGQPGHEALGEVTAVGDGVTELTPGQRVVMWRDRGHNLPGCYAQYVVVTPEDALPVPSDLPGERLASLELAMCVQVSFGQLERLGLVEGREMAVGGLGPAGLVAVQIAKAMGAGKVTGVDPLVERRELALQVGADAAVDPGSADLPSDRGQANAFDSAVDCTGLPASIQSLMDRTRSAVAIFGVLREEVAFGFRHWAGLSLLGYERHNRPAAERALGHIVAGKLDLSPLVSAKLPLSQYAEGVAMLKDKRALKICFLPWS